MSQAERSVFEARQLELRAGGRVLLSGLDWQVGGGQFWCVLGRNGIGKSTLLHAAAGLLEPVAGELLLDGETLAAFSTSRMAAHRGLLLQQQHDAFSMPVLEAVLAGRFVHGAGWAYAEQDRAIASKALERVGLGPLAATDILKLSGGERQRVALATLLAQDPRLYLLDEPTAHQDIAAQMQIMQLLRTLADEGKAVIASCHDINLAYRFATHVLLLGDTRRWSGPTGTTLQADRLGEIFGCRFSLLEQGSRRVFVALPSEGI